MESLLGFSGKALQASQPYCYTDQEVQSQSDGGDGLDIERS